MQKGFDVLLQAFSIPSASMENTLRIGDRVLVDKLTPWFGSEPERGEVVVFHDPGGWLGETVPVDTNPVTGAIQKGLSFVGLMPSAEEKDLISHRGKSLRAVAPLVAAALP